MKKETRTYNAIRNSKYAIIGQLVAIILNFLSRTIFIHTLGGVYLGINGLFTNLLSVLSFAELGFSTAIVYEMYRPLANNDIRRIAALMNFYKKVYQSVGICILVIGLLLMFKLDYFIKDTTVIPDEAPPLWCIYILFLGNTSASYFFNYKRSIVVASQNGYLDSLNQLQFNVLRNILQIAILLLWNNFTLFLIIQLLCTLGGNIAISRKADRLFPYLKQYNHEKIEKSILSSIKKNVFAQACNKLGGVVVGGVDNLLISKFVGVIAVGCYSNYLLIINTLRSLFIQLFVPITASVGNYVTEKTEKESYDFYKKLLFVNTYVAIFMGVCLASLVNSFIGIFWGKEYVFDYWVTLAIILNFYIDRIRLTSQIYIDIKGLFWQIKWRSLCEALLNIILCLLFLVKFDMGFKGVVYAILLCNILVNFWWEAYVVFHNIFKRSISIYLICHAQYLTVMIIIYLSIYFVNQQIPETYMGFVLKSFNAIVISNFLLIVFFRRTEEFKYLKNMIMTRIIKRKK